MTWFRRVALRFTVQVFATAVGLVGGAARASFDGGRFASMSDLLTADEFVDDCIGREGGTIWVSFSPTYRAENRVLAETMKEGLLATGAASEVSVRSFADWDAMADCGSVLAPGPRAVVFVDLYKGRRGEIQTARVVVRRNDECKAAVLSRGEYPGRCDAVRGTKRATPRVVPMIHAGDAIPGRRPHHVPVMVRRQQARDRTTGLLTAAVIEAGFVVGLRVAQGVGGGDSVEANILGGLAYTSTLGLAALAGVTAKSWMVRVPPTRRRRVELGVAGGALVALGGAAIAGIEHVAHRESSTGDEGLRVAQALSELSAAAGVGLVTFAVHRSVAVSPSLAGLTVSGQF